MAGERREAIVYNGSFPGPTLVVDPGDRISLKLVNRLEDPTNLHTHGFHVSPEGNSDNVLLHIEPEETFDYPVRSASQPRARAELVPPAPPRARHAPDVRRHGGRRDLPIARRAPAEAPADARPRAGAPGAGVGRGGAAQALVARACSPASCGWSTGSCNPASRSDEGETQRWRILNATVSDFFDLQLDGHRLVQIAADGNPFERAARARHRPHPARRASGGPRRGRLARQLRAAGAALRSRRRLRRARARARHARLLTRAGGRDGCGRAACSSRSATCATLPVANRRRSRSRCAAGSSSTASPSIRDRVDQFVELDTVEEWTVVNDSPLVHPFHIHVNPFQLTHVNGVPVDEPGYRDTVSIPRSAAASRSARCSPTSRAGPCSTATSSRTPISG